MTSDHTPAQLTLDRFASPIGDLLIATDETGALRALAFDDHGAKMTVQLRRFYGDIPMTPGCAPASIHDALTRYFGDDHSALAAIPTATAGTAFQRAVWSALGEIPVGETASYLDIATRIGDPKSVRAVGMANGANPISIVVPCHRVIGANGSMTGYGGGIERKQWLLAHEGVSMPSPTMTTPSLIP